MIQNMLASVTALVQMVDGWGSFMVTALDITNNLWKQHRNDSIMTFKKMLDLLVKFSRMATFLPPTVNCSVLVCCVQSAEPTICHLLWLRTVKQRKTKHLLKVKWASAGRGCEEAVSHTDVALCVLFAVEMQKLLPLKVHNATRKRPL